MEISQSELKKHLSYDPLTGYFTRNVSAGVSKQGSIAGTKHCLGYINIGLKGQIYPAHRLAWLYVYGEFPSGILDHINRVRHDNRIENLRCVTRSENGINVKLSKRNTTGIKHVSYSEKTGKWYCQLSIKGVKKHKGPFDTKEDAAEAAKTLQQTHHIIG